MPETILDLGKKVKAKHPGQYDDLPDDEVGRRVKAKFPGSYDDFADVTATSPGPQDPRARLGKYVMDTVTNAPGSAWEMAKGIGHAIAHPYETATTLGQVGMGVLQKMAPDTPSHANREFVPYAEAAGESLKNRYGSPSAIAETLRTDPVGALADVSTIAGGVGAAARGSAALAGSKLPRVVSAATKVADAAKAVSSATNPAIIAGKVASKIPIPEKLTPRGLYNSSLKMPPVSVSPVDRDAIVATGIREGIPVSRGGFDEAGRRIEALNSEIARKIANKSDDLGPVINPVDVTKPVNRLRPTFGNQVNPEADLAAINRSKAEFLKKHTVEHPYTKIEPSVNEPGQYAAVGSGSTKTKQSLTIAEAQAEKQGTYRQLRKKYGELGSADVEAQKALARGLKDEIAKRVPELTALNARDGALIELEQQLARFVGREGNKNVLGLIPAIVGTGGGIMAGHSIEGGVAGLMGTLAVLAMDNPAIKSRLAIALDRAKKLKGAAEVGAQAATPVAVAGRAGGSRPDLNSPSPIR